MLDEDALQRVNGLAARHTRLRNLRAPAVALFAIERELLKHGVKLKHSVGPPDPHAPPGGSAVALRKVA